MTEQLLDGLKSSIGGSLMGKFGLSTEQSEGALKETAATASEFVKESSSEGGLSGVTGMLGGLMGGSGDSGNPLVSMLTKNLTEKVGLPAGIVSKVVEFILPKAMELISGDKGGMMSGLLGGKESKGVEESLTDTASGLLGKMF